jgi:hypothetical protein
MIAFLEAGARAMEVKRRPKTRERVAQRTDGVEKLRRSLDSVGWVEKKLTLLGFSSLICGTARSCKWSRRHT